MPGSGYLSGATEAGVAGICLLEDREDLFSTLYCEAGDDSQLIHGQRVLDPVVPEEPRRCHSGRSRTRPSALECGY